MSLEDFLGWDYAYVVAIGLFVVWGLIFGRSFAKNKRSNAKKPLFKRVLMWFTLILIGAFVFFISFLNPTYFGIGTLERFSSIHVIEDKIVLFDNDVSYFDDERSGTEDYTSHLRIHVVNKENKKKLYSELIGSNYSNLVVADKVYLIENSIYQYYSAENKVLNIFQYDLEDQTKKTILKNDGYFKAGAEELKVFTVNVINDIKVTSTSGDIYIYNFKDEVFEPFTGRNFQNIPLKPKEFEMRPILNNSNKKALYFQKTSTEKEFLFGDKIEEFFLNDTSYVLVSSYNDMEKSELTYSMISQNGDLLWSRDMKFFEKIVKGKGFEKIDLAKQDKTICYLTIEKYLYAINISSGEVDWWIAL